jgi:hypothetical protein
MKTVFLILWSLALVIFAPVALLGVVMERSPFTSFLLLFVVFYAFCFSISDTYQPTTGSGRHRSSVLANYLTETVGPWLPASIGLVCSLIVIIACIAVIIRYAKS